MTLIEGHRLGERMPTIAIGKVTVRLGPPPGRLVRAGLANGRMVMPPSALLAAGID